MRLVNATTDKEGNFNYALVQLTREVAKRLLKLQREYRRIKKANDDLYCLEFFDWGVQFGSSFHAPRELKEPNGSWYELPLGASLDAEEASCPCMKVTDTGVLWCAQDKHSDVYFETDEMAWAELVNVASGGSPFAVLEEVEEDVS